MTFYDGVILSLALLLTPLRFSLGCNLFPTRPLMLPFDWLLGLLLLPYLPYLWFLAFLVLNGMLLTILYYNTLPTVAAICTYWFLVDDTFIVHRLRYKQDLRFRRRKLTRYFRRSAVRQKDTPSWGCYPSDPQLSPNAVSAFLSQTFDSYCHINPDFLDILLSDFFLRSDPGSPIFLLDDTDVGICLFGNTDDILIFDTGASISISNAASDFVSWDPMPHHRYLQGITSKTSVQGSGMVRWEMYDDDGALHVIQTQAYYVPDAKARLLSPQAYLRQQQDGALVLRPNHAVYYFNSTQKLTFAKLNNGIVGLPHSALNRRRSSAFWFDSAQLAAEVVAPANSNLSAPQKELLAWYYKLGHFNLPWIQQLARPNKMDPQSEPVLPFRNKLATSLDTTALKCEACRLSKATRLPEGAVKETLRPEKDGALKREVLRVGAKISTDQFVSSMKGRLFHTKGKEPDSQKFTGGTIYVDLSSGYMHIQPQVSLCAQETILGKRKFERILDIHGHKAKTYLGDNGVYRSKEFMNELHKLGQEIHFCGVGAHHQNGVAERAIRTVSDSARTLMLHAALRWPEEVSQDLWPMAMEYAVFLYNRMPNQQSGISPLELLTDTKIDPTILKNARVWGCPCFVLDPKIQDGNKLPRWVPRSRRGQFLGRSSSHASSIGLIRNIKTGALSSQFHVIYNDFYSTVSSESENIAIDQNWDHLFRLMREDLRDDNDKELLPELDNEWLTPDELNTRMTQKEPQRMFRRNTPQTRLREPRNQEEQRENDDINDQNEERDPPPELVQDSDSESDSDGEPDEPAASEGVRRNPPRRLRGINRRYHGDEFVTMVYEEKWKYMMETNDLAFLITLDYKNENELDRQLFLVNQEMLQATDEHGLIHFWHPIYLATKASAEDNPTLKQAMASPERRGWEDAMDKEMDSLLQMKVYEVVPRTDARGFTILDTTWAFKRKRFPDGSIRKLKARLYVQGDQQIEEVDFFETYAPVVQWSTVRILLILGVTMGLITKQVDYTNAFVQANMDNTVFVEMPPMYVKEGFVWRLNKSLYGLRQSPLNFFQHLKRNLEARNWTASEHDPCLFL